MSHRRTLLVRDLDVECLIGVHAHEKRARQRVRVSLDLEVAPNPHHDDIGRVTSYETLVEGIQRLAAGRHIHLVETLADQIADHCLGIQGARRVRVTVLKPDILPGSALVGVVVERSFPDPDNG